MKKRVAALLTAAAVMLTALAGCSGGSASSAAGSSASQTQAASSAPKVGGTLLVGLQGDPASFNPDASPDDFAYFVEENIFSRLVKTDWNNKIIPDLASSWDISADGKTYTFKLKSNVKWHDGQAFSSADVKWTIEEIISKKGYLVSSLGNVTSIETPGADTVVFHLKQSDSSLLTSLSFLGAFILPKHIFEGSDWTTNKAAQEPVGTGPFKFADYQKGVSISLEANKDYFDGSPKIDKLVYKIIPDGNTALQAFKNGELDVLGVVPPYAEVAGLKTAEGTKTVENNTLSRYYLTFNLAKKPWSQPEVRQAIALSVDRSEILEKAFKGVGKVADGFYAPGISWAYNDQAVLPQKDIQKAQQLLEQAGYKKNAQGYYFSADIVTFNMDPFLDTSTVVKANLQAIGIDAKVDSLEQAAWMQRCLTDRDFDITIMGGSVGPDPSALANRVGTKGPLNFMGYSNSKVDQLFEEGGSLVEETDRAAKYKEIQKILAADLPIVPLVEDITVNVYKDYLSGLPYDDALGKAAMTEFTYVTINK